MVELPPYPNDHTNLVLDLPAKHEVIAVQDQSILHQIYAPPLGPCFHGCVMLVQIS